MNTSLQIKTLTREEILIHLDALAGILENCVNGGASVSFMLPFSLDKARTFWRGIAESVARGERLVLVLDTSTGSGAEIFYLRAGWQKVGEIPRYALMPDGAMTATSVFYKFL